MKTITTTLGSREVVTHEQDGSFYSVMFVNNGETATTKRAHHKTATGAKRWATKALWNHVTG